MKQKVFTAHIAKREEVTNDLFKLWLDLGEARQNFTFNAGQYCTIGLDGIWRPYSIVSAPHEEHIELFIELVPPPEGNLTPFLHKAAVGDTVSLMPKAKGIFTFEPAYKNQVMAATVTGIAPFTSIIRDYLRGGNREHIFSVFHGASYQDEFAYLGEFYDFMLERAGMIGLVYVPTVSRPSEERNASWRGRKKRVNLIIEEYLEFWHLLPTDTLVYACGHPGMIEDVKKRLTPKGWKVKEERYWK